MIAPAIQVDLSDLPSSLPPELVDEIRLARIKRIEAEQQQLRAEAELRAQKTRGARYKRWALDDTIGADLERALTPRGAT